MSSSKMMKLLSLQSLSLQKKLKLLLKRLLIIRVMCCPQLIYWSIHLWISLYQFLKGSPLWSGKVDSYAKEASKFSPFTKVVSVLPTKKEKTALEGSYEESKDSSLENFYHIRSLLNSNIFGSFCLRQVCWMCWKCSGHKFHFEALSWWKNNFFHCNNAKDIDLDS